MSGAAELLACLLDGGKSPPFLRSQKSSGLTAVLWELRQDCLSNLLNNCESCFQGCSGKGENWICSVNGIVN